MSNDATQKSALIIGASRGIGAQIALEYLEKGFLVAGTHRGSGVPEGIRGIQADITDQESIAAAIANVVDTAGRLDVLVVSSGIARDNLLLRMNEQELMDVLETNLIGPIWAVKSALRPMLRQKGGSIVLISSVSARYGVAGQSNYTAAKAGLEGFTRSVAKEYATKGIRINVVAPGATETDMTLALTDEQRQGMAKETPLGRLARPEEIAEVVYSVSQASYITGVTVPVAGGGALGY